MKDCAEYIIKMNQYLDGELPVDELSDLLRHLDECPECRRHFESLKVITFETRHLRAETPKGLHESIMQAVDREKPVRRRRVVARLTALAACGALLLVLSNSVTPFLRNVSLFGDTASSDGAAVQEAAAGGSSAEPEEKQNGLRAITGMIAVPGLESDDEGTEQTQPEEPAEGGADETGGQPVFTVPKLSVSERVAYYVIATGSKSPAELFPVESVLLETELGETYILLPGTEQAREDACRTLEEAGYTLHENLENLPETDPEAENGLVVVFESR